MKIVFIGDSLTFGFGVDKKYRWVDIVKNSLPKDTLIINKGVNGDTSTGILSRFYGDVILEAPNYAFIMAGSNDFLMSRSPESVFENIKLMIKDCNINNITPILGIQTPLIETMARECWSSYPDYPFVNYCILDYRNNLINHCNENNIKYIDFYSRFKDLLMNEDKDNLFVDGLHPNEKGYLIMAEEFLKSF